MQSTPNNKLSDGRDGLEIKHVPMKTNLGEPSMSQSGPKAQHKEDQKGSRAAEVANSRDNKAEGDSHY
jgi:hypothetical protein